MEAEAREERSILVCFLVLPNLVFLHTPDHLLRRDTYNELVS